MSKSKTKTLGSSTSKRNNELTKEDKIEMVKTTLQQINDLPEIWYPDNEEIAQVEGAIATLAAEPLDQEAFTSLNEAVRKLDEIYNIVPCVVNSAKTKWFKQTASDTATAVE